MKIQRTFYEFFVNADLKLDLIGLIQLKRKTAIIAVFLFSYFIVGL